MSCHHAITHQLSLQSRSHLYSLLSLSRYRGCCCMSEFAETLLLLTYIQRPKGWTSNYQVYGSSCNVPLVLVMYVRDRVQTRRLDDWTVKSILMPREPAGSQLGDCCGLVPYDSTSGFPFQSLPYKVQRCRTRSGRSGGASDTALHV